MENIAEVCKMMGGYLITGLNPKIDNNLGKIEDVVKALKNYSGKIEGIRHGYGLYPKDIKELSGLGYPILPPSYL